MRPTISLLIMYSTAGRPSHFYTKCTVHRQAAFKLPWHAETSSSYQRKNHQPTSAMGQNNRFAGERTQGSVHVVMVTAQSTVDWR